jgi:hypothetical protein
MEEFPQKATSDRFKDLVNVRSTKANTCAQFGASVDTSHNFCWQGTDALSTLGVTSLARQPEGKY